MSEITAPLMAKYAERHGHSCRVAEMTCGLPASWAKLPLMAMLLLEFDRVLWLDCDVVVVQPWRDIFAEMKPDTAQALVVHHTECGEVPNCGVWMVTGEMQELLVEMFGSHPDQDHPWWEQALVMRLMGYAVEPGPVGRLDTPTTLYERTTFLGPEWNHHPADRHKCDSPYFMHVTQYADRLGTIRDLAARAAGA